MSVIAVTVAGATAAAGLTYVQQRARRQRALERARRAGERELEGVETRKAQEIADAKRRAEARRGRIEAELETRREAVEADEARLERVEGAQERRAGAVQERDTELTERHGAFKARQKELRGRRQALDALDGSFDEHVEAMAGATREEVIETLGRDLSDAARRAAQRASRALEERTDAQAESQARRLIDTACNRYGAPLAQARLINKVELPTKKAVAERIEAENYGLLEVITELTKVEFIPQEGGVLFLQAPDPFTREIGRLAYSRLVKAKSVDEAAARMNADKAEKDLIKIARDAGNRARKLLHLKPVDPEILFLVGKLLYRTSYTQNQWQHAMETAHLCGMMARDMGLPIRTSYRAALLHDIGKVLWAETGAVGSHAVSGGTFAREHGEAPEIVHAIAAHHGDEKPSTPLAHLVAAADALSGARPGARRETVIAYTERVDQIGEICERFAEVRRHYVISGGRELRIEVDPRKIDDLGAAQLSGSLAEAIEEELIYPGQIKVTVMREVKASAVARERTGRR